MIKLGENRMLNGTDEDRMINGLLDIEIHRLSKKHIEVLQWAAEGKTNWEIGKIMGMTVHNVDKHMRKVFRDLRVTNRTQAVVKGIRTGIIK